MLVSIDWIQDFVNFQNLPQGMPDKKEIYKRFTLATAEVEDVKENNGFLEDIVVCEILSFEKHPEADKLNLVTFRLSEQEIRKVICGASNVKVGLKVPFAKNGTKLPNGMTLEPKKIRGILSEGMLCSAEELGLSDHSEGILELDPSIPLGTKMLHVLGLKKDIILDIDNKSLTHRPDLWGHYGMAREFSTIYQLPLKPFQFESTMSLISKGEQQSPPMKLRKESESALVYFEGISVNNIPKFQTPNIMKNRLATVGLRSIHPLVDISNYVMLETGIPLHIYDRKKIQGDELIVHSIQTPMNFQTLDGILRPLAVGDTVISDRQSPLVLAGIMGGERCSVDDSTTDIFIEVANWMPAPVRRTSTRLGLRTDSSMRFEKSLDPNLVRSTLLRTLQILSELAPDCVVVGGVQTLGEDPKKQNLKTIETSVSKINRVLGKTIPKEDIHRILTSLGFEIFQSTSDHFSVRVPSFRGTKDVGIEADLVEEVGRIVGFDNIEPQSPLQPVLPIKLPYEKKIQRKIKNFLALKASAFEVMSYPLVGQNLLDLCLWPKAPELKIMNSLSADHNVMRESLIPSFLEMSSENSKNFDQFRFFEIGRTYHAHKEAFSEEGTRLGIAYYQKKSTPFLDLTNVYFELLNSLNLSFEFVKDNPKFPNSFLPSEWKGVHPVEVHHVKIMGKLSGVIFSVHPLVLKQFKIKGHLSMGFLDLSLFSKQELKEKIKYTPLNKFPPAHFDWTVVAPKNTPVEDILFHPKKIKLKELVSVKLVDIFPMANGVDHAVTLRATLSSSLETLSPELIKQAETMLVDSTQKAGFFIKI